jgi:glycosyltransferase involved in cell wall biosynthesis
MAVTLTQALHELGEHVCLYHTSDRQLHAPLQGMRRRGSRQLNAALSRLFGSTASYDFGLSKELILRTAKADVLHLHNLHGYYLNYPVLLNAWQSKPVVWTWHDLWPVTGRCGFPENDCSKWQTGCGNCGSLTAYPGAWLDRSAAEFAYKTNLYRQMQKLLIVTPSAYLRQQAIYRGFKAEQIIVIPNPVTLAGAHPLSRLQARLALGLPATSPLLLFVAADCQDPRKGYADFHHLVTELGVAAIAIGKPPKLRSPLIRYPGSISNMHTLANYYAAADLLVMTSRADNYPNVSIEAMICGTGVLSYNTGGIADQMPEFWDGLVTNHDLAALKTRCRALLDTPDRLTQLAPHFKDHAQRHWQPAHIAKLYLKAYQQAMQL